MKEKTVEDIVLEIKDKSELMIDLAYSSLLYDNKIIAKEVYDLEDLIDNLYQNIQKKTLELVDNKELGIRDRRARRSTSRCRRRAAWSAPGRTGWCTGTSSRRTS